MKKYYLLRSFKNVDLVMDSKFKTYVRWNLTQKQKKFYGQNIRFYECYKLDICPNKKLKRIHLTCLNCKLRKVISGKDPLVYPIDIAQVWFRQDRSNLNKLITKKLMSLIEVLS
jgi:hypothetical protein